MKRSQLLGFIAMALTLAGAAGCKSARTVAANAQFRAMNASVQQPALSVKLTATILAAQLAFPAATAYVSQAPGGYTVHVSPAGATASLINLPVVFQPGQSYTFIAAPTAFASPTLTAIFLTDDNTAPDSGQMKLRIVHASPDLGQVDAYVVAPGTNLQNVTPTFTNLTFKSASAYITLVPGSYEVYFTAAGQKSIVDDSGPLRFGANQIRTVVALDSTSAYTTSTLADLN